MSKYFIFFIYLILGSTFFLSCKDDSQKKIIPIIVTTNNTPLLRAAGKTGKLVATAKLGDTLYYTGNISQFTSQQKINNLTYDEPWLEVLTSESESAWVYAGFVKFDPNKDRILTEKVLERRLKTVLGQYLADRIAKHNNRYNQVVTEDDFAATYEAAKELRDSVELALARKIMPDSAAMPDMYWIGGLFHGFVPQLANNHRKYHLFFDFEAWRVIAATSKGSNDDKFVALRKSEYAEDGVEYLHKSWSISADENDEKISSLLGSNKHLSVLKSANEMLLHSSLFKSDILNIKAQIMDDITESSSYWQPQADIIKEIDAILNADLAALFTRDDIIALTKRREQFLDFETHKIQLNLRAGE